MHALGAGEGAISCICSNHCLPAAFLAYDQDGVGASDAILSVVAPSLSSTVRPQPAPRVDTGQARCAPGEPDSCKSAGRPPAQRQWLLDTQTGCRIGTGIPTGNKAVWNGACRAGQPTAAVRRSGLAWPADRPLLGTYRDGKREGAATTMDDSVSFEGSYATTCRRGEALSASTDVLLSGRVEKAAGDRRKVVAIASRACRAGRFSPTEVADR